MAKLATAGMLDGGLTATGTCTRITVLSAQPASLTDITTTYPLATTSKVAGDFVKSAGTGTNRKTTISQTTAIAITTSGSATHVAIDNGTDYIVTTCTTQALTAGGTVTIPAWSQEIAQPV